MNTLNLSPKDDFHAACRSKVIPVLPHNNTNCAAMLPDKGTVWGEANEITDFH